MIPIQNDHVTSGGGESRPSANQNIERALNTMYVQTVSDDATRSPLALPLMTRQSNDANDEEESKNVIVTSPDRRNTGASSGKKESF